MLFRRALQTGLLLALVGAPNIAAAQKGGGDGGAPPAFRDRVDATGTLPPGGAKLIRTGAFGRPFADRNAAPAPAARRCVSLLCSGYILLGVAY